MGRPIETRQCIVVYFSTKAEKACVSKTAIKPRLEVRAQALRCHKENLMAAFT